MTSMNISLPEPMRSYIEDQVSAGGYGTASEYLRELIRQDQKQKAEAHLEELLLAGLSSPASEVTDQDWVEIRREVRDRLARRKQDA